MIIKPAIAYTKKQIPFYIVPTRRELEKMQLKADMMLAEREYKILNKEYRSAAITDRNMKI